MKETGPEAPNPYQIGNEASKKGNGKRGRENGKRENRRQSQ